MLVRSHAASAAPAALAFDRSPRAWRSLGVLMAAIVALIAPPSGGQLGNPLDRLGGGEPDRPEVLVEAFSVHPEVAAGERLAVAVVLDHDTNFHTWPSLDQDVLPASIAEFAVRTSITVTDAPEWLSGVGSIQWPEAYDVTNPLGDPPTVKSYKGRAPAFAAFEVGEGAPLGEARVSFDVFFQACDDQVCLIPETRAVTASFVVVEAGAAGSRELSAQQREDAERLDPALLTAEVATTAGGGAGGAAGEHTAGRGGDAISDDARVLVERARGAIDAARTAGADFPYPLTVWNDYSPELVEDARAAGKHVFLDFTADWCINCKALEKAVLDVDPVRTRLRDSDVVMIKVDLTTEDAPGWEYLRSEAINRTGIPTWAVARADRAAPIVVSTTGGAVLAGLADTVDAADMSADASTFEFFGVPIPAGGIGLLAALAVLGAIGGFVLNLTPCVLPVIPIKVLTLSEHAGESKGRALFLGLMMAIGVVAFWTSLAAPVLLLSSFADPSRIFGIWWLSAGIGALIIAMALGMMGLFSINLPQRAYMVNPKADTAWGSFLFGVMTAVLGLPCFGFVASALVPAAAAGGATFTVVLFISMGVGMAAPYLLLSANPQWLKVVPKTGPASELVKQVMGLLLIAAGAYFLGAGVNALTAAEPHLSGQLHWLVAFAFVAGAGVWLLYRTFRITPSTPRRAAFGGVGLACAAAGVSLAVLIASGAAREHAAGAAEFAQIEAQEQERLDRLREAVDAAEAALDAVGGPAGGPSRGVATTATAERVAP